MSNKTTLKIYTMYTLPILSVNSELPNLTKIETLVPNDYKIVGVIYNQRIGDGFDTEFEMQIELPEHDEDAFVKTSLYAEISNNISRGQSRCNHCGKKISYVCLGLHTNGTINTFGHICTGNIKAFHGFNMEAIKKQTLASRVKERNFLAREKFLNDRVGLREALNTNNKIIKDIKESFGKYHSISEKQIELVFKMAKLQHEMDTKTAERESVAKDVPNERVKDQEFKIISIKPVEDFFNGGHIFKSVIENVSDGYRVYGNLPKECVERDDRVNVGDTIKVSVTCSQSEKNTKFGYFKILKFSKK